MEKLLFERLETINEEKNHYKELLKKVNPNLNLNNYVSESFELSLSAKVGNAKEIELTKQNRGLSIHSNLNKDQHHYLFFTNVDEISNIREYLVNHKSKKIVLSVSGYSSGIDIELHFIAIDKEGNRLVDKILLGKEKIFNVEILNNMEQLRIAIRVKGNGTAYIHNPIFYTSKISKRVKRDKVAKRISDLNVVFIADEFTTRSFEPEFNVIKVTPENWENELRGINPDLFFCESAWLGNNGAWKNKIGTGGPRNNSILLGLIDWCKERDVPTIFWNKEDPFHFSAFIETAKYFDYVFTTDQNSIKHYKEVGCENVHVLPFAAQPKYHNPIEKYERKNKIVFAGAYYGDKFPERTEAMDNMINISGDYGIDIYDRNFHNLESPNQFPDKFKKYIVGTLIGNQIEKAYKGYKVSLNVNSIVDSPTMFSRRVFELLASNTPVVSSESLGVKKMLGDVVTASSDYDILKEQIDKLFSDEEYFLIKRLLGLRTVLEGHSYRVRMEEVLNTIGIPFIKDNKTATMIAVVRSKEEYENVLKQFNRQTLKGKKLIILLDIFEGYLDIFNKNNNEEVKSYLIDYIHHYNSINDLIETSHYAPISPKNYYGENYLKDMYLATLYSDNSFIVKGIGQEYTFQTGGKFLLSLIPKGFTSSMSTTEFIQLFESNNQELEQWFKFGFRFLNIDRFNYVEDFNEEDNKKLKNVNI